MDTPRVDIADRYRNLLAAAGAICTYGSVLKALGFASALGGIVLAYFLSETGAPELAAHAAQPSVLGPAVAIFGGLGLGLQLHVTGTFISATGEGLLALADIAANTTPK